MRKKIKKYKHILKEHLSNRTNILIDILILCIIICLYWSIVSTIEAERMRVEEEKIQRQIKIEKEEELKKLNFSEEELLMFSSNYQVIEESGFKYLENRLSEVSNEQALLVESNYNRLLSEKEEFDKNYKSKVDLLNETLDNIMSEDGCLDRNVLRKIYVYPEEKVIDIYAIIDKGRRHVKVASMFELRIDEIIEYCQIYDFNISFRCATYGFASWNVYKNDEGWVKIDAGLQKHNFEKIIGEYYTKKYFPNVKNYD